MTSSRWTNPSAFAEVCEAVDIAVMNGALIPDPRMGGKTDYIAIPVDDVVALLAALSRARGEDVSAGRDARREDVK